MGQKVVKNNMQNLPKPACLSSSLITMPTKTTKKMAKILEFILIMIVVIFSDRSECNELNENTSFDYFSIYTEKIFTTIAHVRLFSM